MGTLYLGFTCITVSYCFHFSKDDDDEYKASGQNYYGIAHTVNEKVTEQASMMVNGKLKEYQVTYETNLGSL